MSYTDFFQIALSKHRRAEERRRDQVLEQHARIMNLLSPMLQGVQDVIVDQLYQSTNAHGPIRLVKSIEAKMLSCYFVLECEGHTLLTIKLDHTQVHLKNGIKQRDWYLGEFDDENVRYIARVIAECVVPGILETKRANEASLVGPDAQ